MSDHEKIKTAKYLSEEVRKCIIQGRIPCDSDIDQLFLYAFDKKKAVSDSCCAYLMEIAGISDEIRNRLEHMMNTGNAHDRWLVTIHVSPRRCPEEFVRKIIMTAIKDKSKKVRLSGIQRAISFKFNDFAPLIKERLLVETDEKCKENLEYGYFMMSQGYVIEKRESKGYWLRFNGWSAIAINEDFSNEDQINEFVRKQYCAKISEQFKSIEWTK